MVDSEFFSPMVEKFAKFWFTADFFAVGLFAFAGVAMRVGIQNSLEGRIEVDTTQNYGPFLQMFNAKPYLLCNLVGCFVMSFCMANVEQISKTSSPLYKGLTTGFCGSLTTFSSWMNGSVNVLWGEQWYKYILMLLIQFMLTWSAFTMGFACAKVVNGALVHNYNPIVINRNTNEANEVSAQEIELSTLGNVQEDVQIEVKSSDDHTGALHSACRIWHNCEYYILLTLLTTVCIILWSILIAESHLTYFDNIKVRDTYRAVALAPLGAWTRWGLTKFPEIKNLWPEMYPQTMIVNLAGVAIMCSLVVFSTSSWVYAINAGFNGSLTTVSTFFAELHNLNIEKGPIISLRYCLATVGLAIAIIQIIRAGNATGS